MSEKPQYQNLLALIQSFETMWAYYSQSDGELYDAECRAIVNSLISAIEDMAGKENSLSDQIEKTTVNKIKYSEIIEKLSGWANNADIAPFGTLGQSRRMLFGFFSGLKLFLHVELQIPFTPTITMSATEIEHGERTMRWKGYLPDKLLKSSMEDPDKLVLGAGDARTIVVVGDIRRSQQLLAYTENPDGFSRFMGRFIGLSRQLIEKHYGFFDKFTGDGFIAYFNENICSELGGDFIECFIDFVNQELSGVNGLFIEWSQSLTRQLDEPVGLAIGADIGMVDFRDVDNHLISIGGAVVWANRMASEGDVGEVIANKPLCDILGSQPNISLTPRNGKTKNGMPFEASKMTIGD